MHTDDQKNYLEVRVTADAIRIEPAYVAPFIAIPVLVLMALWVVLMTSGKRKRKG